MTLVRYIGDQTLTIPSLDLTVGHDEIIDVPPAVAAEFVARADFKAASEPKVAKVDDILAAVGDDRALAQVELDAEQMRGAKARKSLVDALTAIVESPPADADDPDTNQE